MRKVLVVTSFLIVSSFCCAPDVKFKEDHHRRKELDDKFVSNIVELKSHEEVLLKAIEALKLANGKKDENEEVDYKARIEEIEKELRKTKSDHANLLEKHENYVRGYDKPKTWSETIGKWTGDAFGRLIYNALCGAFVILIPLVIRPFQRSWLSRIRGRNDGPTIEEVTDDDEDGVNIQRISTEEVRQILDSEKPDTKRRKPVKSE